jgi:hypothetical protein
MTTSTATPVNATPSKATYHLTGTVIAESHLATCGPALSASKEKNAPQPIPTYTGPNGRIMYMPGAGFRSKLRGAACAIMLEALREKNAKRFTLADAQLNRVGGIKQSGAEADVDTRKYLEMIAANPILGIFGASTPWVSGKAKIGHLSCVNPNLEPMVVDGVRADIVRRDPSIISFLEEGALDAHSDAVARTKSYGIMKKKLKDLNTKMMKAKGDEKAEFKAQIALLEGEMTEGGHKQVSALLPLPGYLAIPRGAEMESVISLVGVSQIELGCFLAALARFAEEPFLGAHSAHGAGIISGKWQVNKVRTGVTGSLTLNPFVGVSLDGNAELESAVAAFYEFIKTDACDPYSNAAILVAAKESEAVVE